MVEDSEFTWPAPFWEQPRWRWTAMIDAGVRASFTASQHAARLMVPRQRGLIVNVSHWAAQKHVGNVIYGIAKAATDKLTADAAVELEDHGVIVVSLYPGLVRTEAVVSAGVFDLSNSESPEFLGRAVAALAADPDLNRWTGQVVVAAALAEHYGFSDLDVVSHGRSPSPTSSMPLEPDVCAYDQLVFHSESKEGPMARSLRRRARLGYFTFSVDRVLSSLPVTVVSLVVALLPLTAFSQVGGDGLPRTRWGVPDLQGLWDFRTLTPLERPRELGRRAFFTDEEAADFEARLLQRWRQGPYRQISPLAALGGGGDFGTAVTSDKRSSLIVDRPNGRIPPLTPEGEATIRAPGRRPVTERVVAGAVGDGPEDLGLFERCILGINSGPPMSPSVYNNNVRVLQTPGYVVLLNEMIHDARIVPLDGRPHLSATVRQWMGDSRGHWEGDTLVVDTTNFTDKASFNGDFLGRGRGGGSGDTFHVVERFTRVGADTLRYEFTVEDRKWWTSPWSAELPMKKTEGPLFEFACHEGNYSMAGMLRGARAQERAERAEAR